MDCGSSEAAAILENRLWKYEVLYSDSVTLAKEIALKPPFSGRIALAFLMKTLTVESS